jgi:subtilisin family serine protease
VVSATPGGGYAAMDGTSMATPHVAGVVALMWSAQPALIGEVDTTSRILRDTARPVEIDDGPACDGDAALVGAGLVDAHAAVTAALTSS